MEWFRLEVYNRAAQTKRLRAGIQALITLFVIENVTLRMTIGMVCTQYNKIMISIHLYL
jgi:hypothetical protein